MHRRRLARPLIASTLVALSFGCAGAPPEAPAPAPPAAPSSAPVAVAAPEEPPPTLRTGAEPVVDLGSVRGEVIRRFDDGTDEVLAVRFTPPGDHPFGFEVVAPGRPGDFVAQSMGESTPSVWLRRPREGRGATEVRVAGRQSPPRGGAVTFRVEVPAGGPAIDPRARAAYAAALADHLRARLGSMEGDAAARRVLAAFVGGGKVRGGPGEAPLPAPQLDLAELMRATTGVGALRAALAHDRPLRSGPAGKADVAIAAVAPPALPTHPWPAMLKELRRAAPSEPLATIAPADAWFVRASSMGALFRALDEADAWGTSAVRAVEDVALESAIVQRYEAQLGLRRSALARAFGDAVVGAIALLGGDPYVREGTDLTLLFQVKQRAAFDAALLDAMGEHARAHGGKTLASKLSHEGVEIRVMETEDGAVRQHRATVRTADAGEVEIVSNSAGGVRRVLDVVKGKRPALAAEVDVQYALARDADVRADVLGLVGESFVRKIVGPGHKIAEARRQIAHAELLVPGFAATLFGWVHGRPPASTDELVRSKLLDRAELTHAEGGSIAFQPGQAPRSGRGTPAFMTPLVDLPEPTRVSTAERDAYRGFVEAYERGWSGEPFDPIAVRFALPSEGALQAHVRVLPIPRDRDIDELLEIVGSTRVQAEPDGRGGRFVVGLSPDERWRRELGLDLGRVLGQERTLDWIGEWAAVGVADQNGLLHALSDHLAIQLPAPDGESPRDLDALRDLARTPLWIGVEVKSPATLGLLLTAGRKMVDDAVPGMVRWGEIGREAEVPIVGVRIAGEAIDSHLEGADVSIFYAIAPPPKGGRAAFYVSLDEGVVRSLLRDHAAGRGPRPGGGAADPAAAQALLDVVARDGGPIATALAWIAEDASRWSGDQSRVLAEWYLRGAGGDPGRAQHLAEVYLGAVPVSPSGKPFVLGPTGVEDPDRGSALAPRFPALPIPGAPITRVTSSIGRMRVETRFDDEPGSTRGQPLRSFVARIAVEPR